MPSLQILFAIVATLLLHPSFTTASAVLPLTHRSSSNPGVDLVNAGSSGQTFYFCDNVSNGVGTADPGFTSDSTEVSSSSLPSGCASIATSVSVSPSATASVTLDLTFKGRVVRTTDTPATWVELQIQNTDSSCGSTCGYGWGDVSLEMGCDGAATVAPADGTGTTVGFSSPADLVDNAPSAATTTRSDGTKVIQAPWYDGTPLCQAAIDYLTETVPGGSSAVYINNTYGTTMATSANNRFLVTFY